MGDEGGGEVAAAPRRAAAHAAARPSTKESKIATAATALDRGTVVDGSWTLEQLIARGGTADVWRATDLRGNRQVAVKVLRDDLATDHRHIRRLIAEAEVTSCLRHPNIVEFLDGGALPCRTPYVVLEYLEGESLRQRLDRGPLPLAEAVEVARQVGAALAAAHRAGVVHRDLKPDNVFLCATGEPSRPRAKVLDFGLSTSFDLEDGDADLVGTPRYMAPEQAARRSDLVDRRSDVFAFGALVYEMLSGRPAFDAEGVARLTFQVMFEEPTALGALVPEAPQHVAAAVHRALEKRQEDRFRDVASFVEALSGAPLPEVGPRTAPATAGWEPRAPAPSSPPARRRAWSRWAFAAAAAALVSAAAVTLAIEEGERSASTYVGDGAARGATQDERPLAARE